MAALTGLTWPDTTMPCATTTWRVVVSRFCVSLQATCSTTKSALEKPFSQLSLADHATTEAPRPPPKLRYVALLLAPLPSPHRGRVDPVQAAILRAIVD